MGSFVSRTLLANDINGPTTIVIPGTQTWYSEPISLTSEDSMAGVFFTLVYSSANNGTVVVEGGTEGNAAGFWAALDSFGAAPTTDGLTLASTGTKGVVSVFAASGQSLPPYLRLKITAGATALNITKILASRRNMI
jgi:hypothetical protein